MTVLLIIHVLIAFLMIFLILIQRAEGGGLSGIGGGGASSGMFTARGSANLLTRLTAILAALFIGNAVLMAVVSGHSAKKQSSILDLADQTKSPSNKNKL